MSSKTEELMSTVLTRSVVGYRDDLDRWDIPVYNTPERLNAADDLANAKVTEALPALEDFFLEGVQTINLVYDADTKGFHHFTYPSELRRLAKALVQLGGAEAFSNLMLVKVLPALQRDRRLSAEEHIRNKEAQVLEFLQKEFGRIGNWEQAEQERRLGIQTRRKTQGQCVMCGMRLPFLDRFLNHEKHSDCRLFAE